MIRNDEGRRFTDEAYATQDEVKAVYNRDDISGVWDKIRSYRFYFDYETELRDNDRNPYKICLTRRLLGTTFDLELRILADLLRIGKLPSPLQDELFLAHEIKALTAASKANGIEVPPKGTLEKLARGELESLPSALFLLDSYSKAYREAFTEKEFSVKGCERINQALLGDDPEAPVKYRKEEVKDVINTLLAPKPEAIPDALNDLSSFLKAVEVPALLKALVIIYVFDVVRPFEFFNEESAALFAKLYLGLSSFGMAGYGLDLESIAFSRSERFFAKLKESEKTLDLTYFINMVLPFLVQEETNLSEEIKGYEEKALEIKAASAPLPVPAPMGGNEFKVEENPAEVALPTFPIGIRPEEVEETAKKLLEVHPQLKKKEAHFYAGHCTIGLHYTIEQFKIGEGTVYETARTSMDDLAGRGFYKKEKIGNKFVYSPIPIQENRK
jgi:hypothetical protein